MLYDQNVAGNDEDFLKFWTDFKVFSLSYSLDPYEVNKANAMLKAEYAKTIDLCENCVRRFKMFLGAQQKGEEKK